jgi:hypothetical protein
MKTLSVTTADNENILLGQAPFYLMSFEGYADTEADTVLIESIRQDGAQYVESFLEPKDINLVVRLRAGSPLELNQLRQQTSRVFNPKNGLLTLVFEDESGAFTIQAVCEHMPKFGGADQRTDGVFQNVQLSLLAPSPYWRTTETIEKPLYAWMPKFKFPAAFGVTSYFAAADYAGKITGDYESNPHLVRYSNSSAVRKPAESGVELTQTQLDQIEFLDGTRFQITNLSNGGMPQLMPSFNVLAMLEKEFGAQVWGGDETTAGQIAIAKTLITELRFIWHGYSTAPVANESELSIWTESTGAYQTSGGGYASHTATAITELQAVALSTYATNNPANSIDAAGFVHANIRGNPSDNVTTSFLYTDYVKLELKAAGQTIQATVFGTKGEAEAVVNTGGNGAPVLITITGFVDTPTIWNQTTGEYITLNTSIAEGERVEINTDDNNLTIDLIDADGIRTDIFSRMSIDSTLFKLAAGENVIEYTAVTQSELSTVSFTYNELYAGI